MTEGTVGELGPGRAVFLPALMGHVWCFAISASAISIGLSIPEGWLANALLAFGIVSALGFGLVSYKDIRSQDKLLDAHIARHAAVTISINPPPAPAATAPEPPRKVLPFAPVNFVEFIWSHRQPDGSFPTIETCVRDMPCKLSKAQEWFTNIKESGYMDGRIPFQSSGKPVLNFERFLQAAKDWMTIWDGKQ